jgi:hypothetical protein
MKRLLAPIGIVAAALALSAWVSYTDLQRRRERWWDNHDGRPDYRDHRTDNRADNRADNGAIRSLSGGRIGRFPVRYPGLVPCVDLA